LRALLDASFLIALFDDDHIFHNSSKAWFKRAEPEGWASCPITENAVVRIMSNRQYGSVRGFGIENVIRAMRTLTENTDHQFWSDVVSIANSKVFNSGRIHGPNQLTDVYLLGLAVENEGRFVTYDRKISISAVRNAQDENLVILTE
jgi:toxin-antitoxin system PIN domain toxin